MKKILMALMVVGLVCFFLTGSVYATGRVDDMSVKLGRGLTNVLTGAFEFGNEVDYSIAEQGVWKGSIFGIIKGVQKAVVRIGAGLYETLTFPIEYPADFKPILEPEYIVGKKN
jgi:putative exosortase-associated protein (TIGR04073 family)